MSSEASETGARENEENPVITKAGVVKKVRYISHVNTKKQDPEPVQRKKTKAVNEQNLDRSITKNRKLKCNGSELKRLFKMAINPLITLFYCSVQYFNFAINQSQIRTNKMVQQM